MNDIVSKMNNYQDKMNIKLIYNPLWVVIVAFC